MDEFDAPRKMPVEYCDIVPHLEELQRQTSQLFEEFLFLEESLAFSSLDIPSPASYDYLKDEQADSPIEVSHYKDQKRKAKPASKSAKPIPCTCSLDDDVVADSASVPTAVARGAVAARQPVEQEEKEESEKDNKIKELAKELQKAGDAFVGVYGPRIKDTEGKLLQIIKQEASDLTYERFSLAIDNLVGEDKNWTNFVFAFCVGKRVCNHSKEIFDYSKDFFSQYVHSYSQTIHETGGLVSTCNTGLSESIMEMLNPLNCGFVRQICMTTPPTNV